MLKKLYSILSLLIFFALPVSASELLGNISTDPGNVKNIIIENTPSSKEKIPVLIPKSSGGQTVYGTDSNVYNNQEKPLPDSRTYIEEEGENKGKEQVDVLGVTAYAEGTLLRGSNLRIYVIENQLRRYISSFAQLDKYRGQPILSIAQSEINEIPVLNYQDGDLIRQKGDEKVYVIKKGIGLHVRSIEELRLNFTGKEIYDLEFNEMRNYI